MNKRKFNRIVTTILFSIVSIRSHKIVYTRMIEACGVE
jgi:hypothetical protein